MMAGGEMTDSSDRMKRLARMERVGRLLDEQFVLPGTGYRFGLDGLLGLLPGGGDALTAGLSAYLIYEAARAGVRKRTLLRMAGNLLVDFFVGSVPVAGDLFDFFWKANRKNIALACRDLEGPP
jgi:hypothetical protein